MSGTYSSKHERDIGFDVEVGRLCIEGYPEILLASVETANRVSYTSHFHGNTELQQEDIRKLKERGLVVLK